MIARQKKRVGRKVHVEVVREDAAVLYGAYRMEQEMPVWARQNRNSRRLFRQQVRARRNADLRAHFKRPDAKVDDLLKIATRRIRNYLLQMAETAEFLASSDRDLPYIGLAKVLQGVADATGSFLKNLADRKRAATAAEELGFILQSLAAAATSPGEADQGDSDEESHE
jgi:hypothetical protein